MVLVKIKAMELNLYSEFESAAPWMEKLCDDKGKGKGKGKVNPRTGHEGP